MQILQIETKKYACLKREVGIEFLKIEISHPCFTNCVEKDVKVERMNEFYEKIAENCKKYAETQLLEKIRAEYENSTDPRKRFNFKKYVYKIEYAVTEQNDSTLCVCIDVSLFRAGRRENYKRSSQVWKISSGGLCPPKIKKGKKIKNADGYYIKGGKNFIYSHGGGYAEEEI